MILDGKRFHWAMSHPLARLTSESLKGNFLAERRDSNYPHFCKSLILKEDNLKYA